MKIIVYGLIICCLVSSGFANPNEIWGEDLDQDIQNTFRYIQKSNLLPKEVWKDNSESQIPSQEMLSDPNFNIFKFHYWSIEKICLLKDVNQFIKETKITDQKTVDLLNRSAAFMYNGKVYLVGTHPVYQNLIIGKQKYGWDLYKPVLGAIIIHEIAHTMYQDHAEVYKIGVMFLQQQLNLAKIMHEKGTKGFDANYLKVVKYYLSDQIFRHDLHSST